MIDTATLRETAAALAPDGIPEDKWRYVLANVSPDVVDGYIGGYLTAVEVVELYNFSTLAGSLHLEAKSPFVTAAEFWEGQDEIEYLVPDLVPCGGLCIIAGRPKAGKTLMALNLAVAVAQGGEFLGRVCQQEPVGVIQLEDPAPLILHRLKAMTDTPPPGLMIAAGFAWDEAARGRVLRWVNEYGLKLLIVDPLVLWRPGTKENSAEEMAALLYGLRKVAQETGCTVQIIHHNRKGDGGDYGDGIRGSGAILGAVDVALEMVKEEDGQATLKVHSRLESVPDEAIRLRVDSLTWESLGVARDVKEAERLTEVLHLIGEIGPVTAQEIMATLDLSKTTLYRTLQALEADAAIVSEEVPGSGGRPAKAYSIAGADTFSQAPAEREVFPTPLGKSKTASELLNNSPEGLIPIIPDPGGIELGKKSPDALINERQGEFPC